MPCLGIEHQRRRLGIANAEKIGQDRNVVDQFGNGRFDPRSNLRTRRLRIVRGSNPEKGPEEFHERLQRPGMVVRRCPEIQHRHQAVPRHLGEFETQPALSEAGRRRNSNRLAGAAFGAGKGVMQNRKLGIASAIGPDDRVAKGGAGRLHSDQPVNSDRPWKPLDVLMAQWTAIAMRVHQLERRFRDADVAGLRHMLEPAGEMHGGAVDALLPRELVRQAGDDLTGVNPDPKRDAVFARRLHHRQRGLTGAQGVIFLRVGNAEDHHQPVAHAAHDGALKSIDRIPHAGQRRRKAIERVLGVLVADQFGRADDVGEQDGNDLALAERLRLVEAIAAGAAESRGAKVGMLAIRTDDGKADAARAADPRRPPTSPSDRPGTALMNP